MGRATAFISSREKFIRMWRNRKTPDVISFCIHRGIYLIILVSFINNYDVQCRIVGSTPTILTKMQNSYNGLVYNTAYVEVRVRFSYSAPVLL